MSESDKGPGSSRWQRVFAIFEQAIERSVEERSAFLDQVCADDALLRRGVEELLEAHAEKTMFLDRPIFRHGAEVSSTDLADDEDTVDQATIDPTPEADLPFTTLGPYRILRQIGQGGMSTVYSAAREDDAYRRPMVVKVVRHDMQSEAMSRRLRAERQILAGLEHPNIARLYDGASTDDGMPYFVMEYVEGMPIDRYCEENQLSVDERLTLFRKVCAAVHYAHQNLVVHRDIKPSNILVTTDGEPKLLDFGIAKLLNPGLGGADIEPTAHWQRLMTPSFASPEQIRGLPITTVSDVYSLGCCSTGCSPGVCRTSSRAGRLTRSNAFSPRPSHRSPAPWSRERSRPGIATRRAQGRQTRRGRGLPIRRRQRTNLDPVSHTGS